MLCTNSVRVLRHLTLVRMREDVYDIGFRTRRKFARFSTGTHYYAHRYRSTFIFIFMFVLFTLLIYTYIQLLHHFICCYLGTYVLSLYHWRS